LWNFSLKSPKKNHNGTNRVFNMHMMIKTNSLLYSLVKINNYLLNLPISLRQL